MSGCSAYWVVDPDEPSIFAWHLREGTYVEAARAAGNETFAADVPVRMECSPVDLIN